MQDRDRVLRRGPADSLRGVEGSGALKASRGHQGWRCQARCLVYTQGSLGSIDSRPQSKSRVHGRSRVGESFSAGDKLRCEHERLNMLQVDPRGISLRFPRFIRVREDKDADDATNPQQVSCQSAAKPPSGASELQSSESSPDRLRKCMSVKHWPRVKARRKAAVAMRTMGFGETKRMKRS